MLLGQRRLIARELAEGQLVTLAEPALPLSKPYYVVYPPRTLENPAQRRFWPGCKPSHLQTKPEPRRRCLLASGTTLNA